jgi:tetratricopeptide (TPR) repeat protein
LYVEEITKSVLESGALKEADGQYELTGPVSSLAIPATLQDSLMARLDRLVTAKAVAQYAAVIGRQFSYALLHTVSQLDESTLQRELGRLVAAELVYQRGLPPHATYTFKHALIQDTAYESLLRRTRQQYHAQIATVLQTQFRAVAEQQPELLAQHYTEADLNEKAIRYWQQAGEQAVKRSALAEAVAHLTIGIELLHLLPENPDRDQHELSLCLILGPTLIATKGYGSPEVERIYNRARFLYEQTPVREPTQRFQVLAGLRAVYMSRGELHTARDLGGQLLSLAQQQAEPLLQAEAHRALMLAVFYLGEFAAACAHAQEGMALYDPVKVTSLNRWSDPRVAFLSYSAIALWFLGYADQALARSREALRLAQDLADTHSRALGLGFASVLHGLLQRGEATQVLAETGIALARKEGFAFWEAFGTICLGWAFTVRKDVDTGLALMRQGLMDIRPAGGIPFESWVLTLMAAAYGHIEQIDEGFHVLTEVQAFSQKTGECAYRAELFRTQGDLLLASQVSTETESEGYYQQALDVARSQHAKSLELRAATSLAKLWQSQNKREEAYELLAPVHGWFTEGFDTADLIDAKALLDALEGERSCTA